MRSAIILAIVLSACGTEEPDQPDRVTTAPSEPVEDKPECQSQADVGRTAPIEAPPGIEPCNGTTPYCQRFTCAVCEETRPDFYEWTPRSSCD